MDSLGACAAPLTMSPFLCLRAICAFPLSMYLFLWVCGCEDLLWYWRCIYCSWGCIGNIVIDLENVQVACSHRNTALRLGPCNSQTGSSCFGFSDVYSQIFPKRLTLVLRDRASGWTTLVDSLGACAAPLTMSPFLCLRAICAFPLSMYLFLRVCGWEN